MQKIVILNPKGGSGKSTIATNLASYFAVQGLNPTLMDLDTQGSSMHWLKKRTMEQPIIHGIAGFERNTRVTRSFATRIPPETQRLVIDTPAALEPQRLPEITHNATAVLVPVLPSHIDIHAATKCISDLLLTAKIRRNEHRIAIIANRVKKNTLVYASLLQFLETLRIPVVATLRDSQNYIRTAESGAGLFEMKPYTVREDLDQWLPLLGWLSRRTALPIEAGTPAVTSRVDTPLPATQFPITLPLASVNDSTDEASSTPAAEAPPPARTFLHRLLKRH
ncbi:chromosome partitioning protein [Steroidobacter denitrificans]|uniref:Chromosome partitioning protein n=1 Tax=Steroidobacter denitrificans TaxID=465721 RepID=A0A127F5R5_STEDE|nr:AAA family ATPase [Steroidobacter denitrificans]AMN45773.1 chromosome partitioning protein [Steroidobacter denitrificans]